MSSNDGEEPTPEEDEDKKEAAATETEERDDDDSPSQPSEEINQEDGSTSDNEKKRKSSSAREPRNRKSTQAFVPENFRELDKSVKFLPGRGVALKSLEGVRDSLHGYQKNVDDLLVLHRLLYTQRGKPPKKELFTNILEFSGYLPEPTLSGSEQEAVDEECEAKMGTKAYKLTVPVLRKVCDMLTIDRSGCTDKDKLVDVLLDFLGEPSAEALKSAAGSNKRAKKSTEAASDKKDDNNNDDYEYSDLEDDNSSAADDGSLGDEKPSKEQLRKWVRAYVRCHSMKTATLKEAIAIASDKFDFDLKGEKQTIKELIAEEM